MKVRSTVIFEIRKCCNYFNVSLKINEVVSSKIKRDQADIKTKSNYDRARSSRNSLEVKQRIKNKDKRNSRVLLKDRKFRTQLCDLH